MSNPFLRGLWFAAGCVVVVGAVALMVQLERMQNAEGRRDDDDDEAQRGDPGAEPPQAGTPSAPSKEEESGGTVEVRGVTLSSAQANAVVRAVNSLDEEAMREAGIVIGAVRAMIERRPFASIQAIAATKGVGPKTLASLRDAFGDADQRASG